jgi:hypothetical protein
MVSGWEVEGGTATICSSVGESAEVRSLWVTFLLPEPPFDGPVSTAASGALSFMFIQGSSSSNEFWPVGAFKFGCECGTSVALELPRPEQTRSK